jgi:hypothetical protein
MVVKVSQGRTTVSINAADHRMGICAWQWKSQPWRDATGNEKRPPERAAFSAGMVTAGVALGERESGGLFQIPRGFP